MVLHPLEDDSPASGGQYLIPLHLKELPDLKLLNLFLEQLLDRLVKRLLDFTDTYNVGLIGHAPSDDVFSECVGFARSASTEGCTVSSWLSENFDGPARDLNVEGRQWSISPLKPMDRHQGR